MRRLNTAKALELVPQVERAGDGPVVKRWDAAVKRAFSLRGMLASLGANSEASAAKRLPCEALWCQLAPSVCS